MWKVEGLRDICTSSNPRVSFRIRDILAARSSPDTNTTPEPSEPPVTSVSSPPTIWNPYDAWNYTIAGYSSPFLSSTWYSMLAHQPSTNTLPWLQFPAESTVRSIDDDGTSSHGGGLLDGEVDSRKQGRRNRTVFTETQLMGLERRFDTQKYLSTPDRAQVAQALGLTQLQVKTWYQNRRMKWKKQVMQGGCTVPPTKPKGRPKKNSIPSRNDLCNTHFQLLHEIQHPTLSVTSSVPQNIVPIISQ